MTKHLCGTCQAVHEPGKYYNHNFVAPISSNQRCIVCDAVMERQQYPDPKGYAVARYKYVCPNCAAPLNLVPHTLTELVNDLRDAAETLRGWGAPEDFSIAVTIDRAIAALGDSVGLSDETRAPISKWPCCPYCGSRLEQTQVGRFKCVSCDILRKSAQETFGNPPEK